jgi:hypothetical protein
MIMEARQKRLSTPLQWGRREKTAVAGALAVLVLALLALGAYALTSGSPGRKDCVEALAPSTLGAVRIHGCGGNARQLCSTALRQRDRRIADALGQSCRRAGIPVG